MRAIIVLILVLLATPAFSQASPKNRNRLMTCKSKSLSHKLNRLGCRMNWTG